MRKEQRKKFCGRKNLDCNVVVSFKNVLKIVNTFK
jgi:hypothetical protein